MLTIAAGVALSSEANSESVASADVDSEPIVSAADSEPIVSATDSEPIVSMANSEAIVTVVHNEPIVSTVSVVNTEVSAACDLRTLNRELVQNIRPKVAGQSQLLASSISHTPLGLQRVSKAQGAPTNTDTLAASRRATPYRCKRVLGGCELH